jgi:hypothetical protein
LFTRGLIKIFVSDIGDTSILKRVATSVKMNMRLVINVGQIDFVNACGNSVLRHCDDVDDDEQMIEFKKYNIQLDAFQLGVLSATLSGARIAGVIKTDAAKMVIDQVLAQIHSINFDEDETS